MLLSAEIILLGAMLGCLAGYWAAGYHVSGNLAQQASLGQGSLMVVALAAMGQPIVALAVLYPVSHGLTDRGLEDSSLEDSAEIGLLPGETARGEVLAMAAGLLILMGMLLS